MKLFLAYQLPSLANPFTTAFSSATVEIAITSNFRACTVSAKTIRPAINIAIALIIAGTRWRLAEAEFIEVRGANPIRPFATTIGQGSETDIFLWLVAGRGFCLSRKSDHHQKKQYCRNNQTPPVFGFSAPVHDIPFMIGQCRKNIRSIPIQTQQD